MRAKPRHQPPIPGLGRGERLDTEHTPNMVDHSGDMHIGVSVDTADHRIRVGSYDGHCHPSSLVDRGGTHLPGGWTRGHQVLALTGQGTVSRPTGECRSRAQPARHSKDNPQVSAGS